MYNRRQQLKTEQTQTPLTLSQQFIYESMKRGGSLDDLADRTQPVNLPPGVSLEALVNDLGNLYYDVMFGERA